MTPPLPKKREKKKTQKKLIKEGKENWKDRCTGIVFQVVPFTAKASRPIILASRYCCLVPTLLLPCRNLKLNEIPFLYLTNKKCISFQDGPIYMQLIRRLKANSDLVSKLHYTTYWSILDPSNTYWKFKNCIFRYWV